ncbi:alpha/beta hydrolase [Rhizobium sp. AU243]|uniref:alpha/beta hydrolase n=1 Tax=Rhizobium sp. AU243 TaxID=2303425 RepID=UPI0010CB0F6A|nr:alpha/beta hydrolase [Rhizobium sp. AU243]TKV70568.1 alpha/beta hydrolase [Rhizobium sp. AU243]
MSLPTQKGVIHAAYDLGNTVMYASKSDPRFSYCLYVPKTFSKEMERQPRLVVAMHGTTRTSFYEFREALAEFARWNNCIVLCPMFPVGVLGDGNRNGYKYLREGSIRYDNALLDIVDEVRENYGLEDRRFALFGFSGGGHFVHRFYLLHPERLWAVSIGAPGSVTLLDAEKDWWVGVRNVEEIFGRPIDVDALGKVPVHMVVGEADLETWEITHQPTSPLYMEGANDSGRTRPERLRTLQASFERQGIKVQFDGVPGVTHDRMKCIERTKDFFHHVLKEEGHL